MLDAWFSDITAIYSTAITAALFVTLMVVSTQRTKKKIKKFADNTRSVYNADLAKIVAERDQFRAVVKDLVSQHNNLIAYAYELAAVRDLFDSINIVANISGSRVTKATVLAHMKTIASERERSFLTKHNLTELPDPTNPAVSSVIESTPSE